MNTTSRTYSIGEDINNLLLGFSVPRKLAFGDKNSFEIRRSGDNEKNLFFYKNNYLTDTAEIDSFIAAGGTGEGFTTEWINQSNLSYKVLQTATNQQPKYIGNGINNLPSFELEGKVDSILTLDGDSSISQSTAATIFCVVDIQGNQGVFGNSFFQTDTVFGSDMFKTTLSNNDLFFQPRNSSNQAKSVPSIPNCLGKHIWTIKFDGIDQMWVYKDGILQENYPATIAGGFLNTFRTIRLGGFNGHYSECLVYNAFLEERKQKEIERNLSSFYGITVG